MQSSGLALLTCSRLTQIFRFPFRPCDDARRMGAFNPWQGADCASTQVAVSTCPGSRWLRASRRIRCRGSSSRGVAAYNACTPTAVLLSHRLIVDKFSQPMASKPLERRSVVASLLAQLKVDHRGRPGWAPLLRHRRRRRSMTAISICGAPWAARHDTYWAWRWRSRSCPWRELPATAELLDGTRPLSRPSACKAPVI